MPRSPTGDYTLPLPPVISGDVIESSWANTTLADMQSALTDSLSRSQQGNPSQPILFVDGTTSIPSISFVNEANSGFSRPAAGEVYISVLGAEYMRWTDAAGVQVKSSGIWYNVTTALEFDLLEIRVTANEGDIITLQDAVVVLDDNLITAMTWDGDDLVSTFTAGNYTVPIKLVNDFKSGGQIRHASDPVVESANITLDNTNFTRFTLPCSGAINLTIPRPTSADAELGEDYSVEGTVLVTNTGIGGTITLVGVAAANIRGAQTFDFDASYVLSYIIHHRAGDTYEELYIWGT